MYDISRVVEYKPALVTSRDALTGYLIHSYVNEVSDMYYTHTECELPPKIIGLIK